MKSDDPFEAVLALPAAVGHGEPGDPHFSFAELAMSGLVLGRLAPNWPPGSFAAEVAEPRRVLGNLLIITGLVFDRLDSEAVRAALASVALLVAAQDDAGGAASAPR